MISFKAASNLHARSFKNSSLLKISDYAACFGCITKFPAESVTKFSWQGHAHCPKCNRQTVIGDTIVQGNFAIRSSLEKQEMIDISETFDLSQNFQENKVVREFNLED